jgi:hypothetical protein
MFAIFFADFATRGGLLAIAIVTAVEIHFVGSQGGVKLPTGGIGIFPEPASASHKEGQQIR